MATKHPLKVFISYASADREQAQKLHAHLLSLGADPWLDTENLLPGQDWKVEISKALDETDLILLCLSKKSVSKEGYVQKEMRLALDRALEIPPGEIFLVPARLDDVNLPYSLRDFQWVDLFTDGGMKKLAASLNLRAGKVKTAPLDIAESPVPKIEKEKAAPRKKPEEKPSTTVIHIHGDVIGENIAIGDRNKIENQTNEKDL